MASLLVIEDHPLFGQSLHKLLHDRGQHDVTVVTSAEAALQRLSEVDYEVILIDVSLPGKSGIELLGEIHQRKPDQRCLMVSGHVEGQYVHRAMAAGARGYVLKEDINGILEAVKKVMGGGTYTSKPLRGK